MLEKERFLTEYQEKLKPEKLSVARFILPIKEESILGFYPPMFSPEHKGPFATAVDIAVPDPRLKKTIVYAPCDGVVFVGVLNQHHWGNEASDAKYLNWVNISLPEGEFYELAHIGFIPEKILVPGRMIKKGEPIAKVALNGRITMDKDGKPDAHIHMYVGKWTGIGKHEGRKINWDLG